MTQQERQWTEMYGELPYRGTTFADDMHRQDVQDIARCREEEQAEANRVAPLPKK